MRVDCIRNLHQFHQLKINWESVYAADLYAHFFSSWIWLKGWFEITPYDWYVLAARPEEEPAYVAFFPLNIRFLRITKFNLIRELRMAGKPIGGYTGFVCLPEYEEKAMAAFARYIQEELEWDSFQMEHVLDCRLDLFLKHFALAKFDVREIGRIASTYIPLPDKWEEYLQNCLPIKVRQNLKRHTRQIESRPEIRLVQTQDCNLDDQIGAAQMLNQSKWGPRANDILNWERSLLRHSFDNDRLWLGVLWDNSTPVSARVALIDQQKKAIYDYFTGYNTDYARLSPGTVILGYSIRDAIGNEFEAYDFLMGEENYKLDLGARRRDDAVTTVIARKNVRSRIANLGLDLARRLRDLLKMGHH